MSSKETKKKICKMIKNKKPNKILRWTPGLGLNNEIEKEKEKILKDKINTFIIKNKEYFKNVKDYEKLNKFYIGRSAYGWCKKKNECGGLGYFAVQTSNDRFNKILNFINKESISDLNKIYNIIVQLTGQCDSWWE